MTRTDLPLSMSGRRGRARGERWLAWLLVAASVVLAVVMQPLGEVGGALWFAGDLATAPSESMEVRRLPFFEGVRRSSSIYALDYRFRGPDGRVHNGVSYVSDREQGAADRSVVEYRAGVPEISRLRGHRLTPGGPLGLVVLVPGLFGVLLLRSRGATRGRGTWLRLRSCWPRAARSFSAEKGGCGRWPSSSVARTVQRRGVCRGRK